MRNSELWWKFLAEFQLDGYLLLKEKELGGGDTSGRTVFLGKRLTFG